MTDHIKIGLEDHVLTVRFARPEKKNAITRAMYTAVAGAIAGAEENTDIRVIVIAGTENCFTAGNDIQDFLANPPRDENAPPLRYLRAIATTPVPLIASVDGVAVGIGTTTLLHCDFALVSDRAMLRMPFLDLGLVPEGASTYLLPRMLGHQKAAELLLLGEAISPADAVDLGIASRVVPAGELEEETAALAARLAAKAPGAVRQTKKLMKRNSDDVVAAIAAESTIFGERLASAEAREAFMAFMEKRAPDFSKTR